MHSGVVYHISNLLLVIFWFTAANIVLDSRLSKMKTLLIGTAVLFPSMYLSENALAVFSLTRYVLGITVPVLLVQILYKDKWLIKLMTVVLFFITLVFSEVLVSMMLPRDQVMSGELFQTHAVSLYTIYLFINLVFLTFVVIVILSYKRKYLGLIVEKQLYLFAFFPFSQLISFTRFFHNYMQDDPFTSAIHVLITVMVNIIADIMLFVALRMTANSTELKIRNEMLEDQIKTEKNFYDSLRSTIEDTRKMRHDIDNHLYTIQALLKDGKNREASDYARTISSEDTIHVRFPSCHNAIVASYLQSKANDLQTAGIRFETDIHIPDSLHIEDSDLICVFGNILDNAKEACIGHADPFIRLSSYFKSSYLTIQCKNPVDRNSQKKKRIPELDRGIGFTILTSLAERYDGQFTSEIREDIFYTEIILKNGKPKEEQL